MSDGECPYCDEEVDPEEFHTSEAMTFKFRCSSCGRQIMAEVEIIDVNYWLSPCESLPEPKKGR